ncbi:hypothetical protein V1577_16285 [Enterobacter bugandensis]|uniref:hypothetical protein n=1 Tax=Enterobacter bugandensis TaxID=881260 RepID=UPI002FD3EC05
MKKRLSVSLFFTLMSTFLSSYEVVAQTMPRILAKDDFSLQLNDQIVALGERWTPEAAREIAVSVEGSFVGEVPFDGTNYKFYQHQKTGLKIFSSNLWWDKTERSVDYYIVAQITLTAPDGKTVRGIHIGSTINELNKAYGSGQVENDSGEQWVSYELGKKCSLLSLKTVRL